MIPIHYERVDSKYAKSYELNLPELNHDQPEADTVVPIWGSIIGHDSMVLNYVSHEVDPTKLSRGYSDGGQLHNGEIVNYVYIRDVINAATFVGPGYLELDSKSAYTLSDECIVEKNGTASTFIVPEEGYLLPEKLEEWSVQGATLISYNNQTGEIVVADPTSARISLYFNERPAPPDPLYTGKSFDKFVLNPDGYDRDRLYNYLNNFELKGEHIKQLLSCTDDYGLWVQDSIEESKELGFKILTGCLPAGDGYLYLVWSPESISEFGDFGYVSS